MPKKLTVTAMIPANEKKGTRQLGPTTIEVDAGETAAESIKMFGDDAVNSNANANWVVTLQGNIRAGLKKGETQKQLQARLGGAKMGVAQKGVKVDRMALWENEYSTATPERQKEMVQELMQRAKKKAA